MGYDRGDSFPFDFEPNQILFGSKSKGKLWANPNAQDRLNVLTQSVDQWTSMRDVTSNSATTGITESSVHSISRLKHFKPV